MYSFSFARCKDFWRLVAQQREGLKIPEHLEMVKMIDVMCILPQLKKN